MSNNEIPQGVDPVAQALAQQIENGAKQHPPSSDAWTEFVSTVNKRPELLQQVQQKLRQDGFHLTEYDRYQLPSAQITRGSAPHPEAGHANGPPTPLYPGAGQRSPEAPSATTTLPTTSPGALFKFGPSQPSSYYPQEGQATRQPVQGPPASGHPDYHPNAVQRSEIPPLKNQASTLAPGTVVPPPEATGATGLKPVPPALQEHGADRSVNPNDPAVKAADDIAKQALELKEKHGDYWKLIHDESYKYYRNEKDGGAYLRFQKELNHKLHEEHILPGERKADVHHGDHRRGFKHQGTHSRDIPTPPPEPPERQRAAAPADVPKPADTPRPADVPKPADTPRPADVPKPADTPKPADIPKPADTPKPAAAAPFALPTVDEIEINPAKASDAVTTHFLAEAEKSENKNLELGLGDKRVLTDAIKAADRFDPDNVAQRESTRYNLITTYIAASNKDSLKAEAVDAVSQLQQLDANFLKNRGIDSATLEAAGIKQSDLGLATQDK